MSPSDWTTAARAELVHSRQDEAKLAESARRVQHSRSCCTLRARKRRLPRRSGPCQTKALGTPSLYNCLLDTGTASQSARNGTHRPEAQFLALVTPSPARRVKACSQVGIGATRRPSVTCLRQRRLQMPGFLPLTLRVFAVGQVAAPSGGLLAVRGLPHLQHLHTCSVRISASAAGWERAHV